MRVAIVAPSPVPFRSGGAERLFDGLTAAINERIEHSADLIKLPSPEHSFVDIIDSYERFSELDLSHFDLVVSTKYPAWMIEHPNHVLYLLHTLRGLYDSYHFTSEPTEIVDPPPGVAGLLTSLAALEYRNGTVAAVFKNAREAVARLGADHPVFRFPGPLIRRVVHTLDSAALAPPRTRRHFSISRTVADRDYFPSGVTSGVAYPPSNLTGFREGSADYLFTASRLDVPKRIGLIIEAYLMADLDIPLKIAGTGEEEERLIQLAGGDPRIEFLGRVSDDELIDLYADALAVPFVPYDEDLGLITLEAMHCGTPVITCSDSGGPVEIVDHGKNGLVAQPDPAALAAAFETLGRNPDRARRMAPACLATAQSATWDTVVDALLGGGDISDASLPAMQPNTTTPFTTAIDHDRPHIVMLSTYPYYPSDSGGRIRGSHLVAGLLEAFDIDIIVTAQAEQPASMSSPMPGVTQRIIRLPEPAYRAEREWMDDVDWIPISDVAAGLTVESSPEFLRSVGDAARGATAIILSHPYLVQALDAVSDCPPVILDAVDLEVDQKQRALPDTDTGASLKRAVEVFERYATAKADLITACSPDDVAGIVRYYQPEASVEVIPNGTDVNGVEFIDAENRSVSTQRWLERFNATSDSTFEAMALFVASWHPPNIQAARAILDMASEARGVVFVLAGSHSQYFDGWRIPPNVVNAGYVSDFVKRGLLASATMALNPMASGSGTNLKILEYWASGIPTISTSFGVRGIDAVAGTHYIEAPVDGFPAAIAGASKDPEGMSAMTEAARALVEMSYDWEVIGSDFRQLVEDLIG